MTQKGDVAVAGKWCVIGKDFAESGDDGFYLIGKPHDDDAAARRSARNYLAQPAHKGGLKDRVYIVDPAGKRKRFTL